MSAAYWKYTVRRRLAGEKRGSFALKGSNWFAAADDLDEPTWREYVQLLDAEHRALREAVARLDPARLCEQPGGSPLTWLDLIEGIAFHDVYHAGQIQGLKRLNRPGEAD